MGFFDFLFDSEQKTQQKDTVDVTTAATKDVIATDRQQTDSTRESSATTQQDTTQQQVTTQLDPETQAILQNLIQGLSGTLGGGGGSIVDPSVLEKSGENLDFASFLQTRAGETEGILGGNTEAIISEARRTGENALELQGTQLAAGAGSNLNSIVQAAQAQGRGDLESQLAALRGQLGIQARQAGSQDLATAFGASNEAARAGADIDIAGKTAGTSQLATLVQALTGATTTTVGESSAAGVTTEQETLEQLLASLRESSERAGQTSKTGRTTTGVASGSDSLFDSGVKLLDLFVDN